MCKADLDSPQKNQNKVWNVFIIREMYCKSRALAEWLYFYELIGQNVNPRNQLSLSHNNYVYYSTY